MRLALGRERRRVLVHEMSLALEIRAICERELAAQGGSRLVAVGVEVGAFAGVNVESLRFCLEAAMAETFGTVRCDVREVPGFARCAACGSGFPVVRAPFECPGCGAVAWGVSGGEDLRVSYVELEGGAT